MKYTGTIIGMKSNLGSIYHVVVDDPKCYLWKANVVADFNGKMLLIRFDWNGDPFELKLRELKEGYYTGDILWHNEPGGNSYFWLFTRGQDALLKGDFNEDDVSYECFIELKPFKTIES